MSEKSYCHVHFNAFSPKVGNLSQPLQLSPEALKNHLNMEKKKLQPPDHTKDAICIVHKLAESATLTPCFECLIRASATCRGGARGHAALMRSGDRVTNLSSSDLVADAVQRVDEDARGSAGGVGQIVLDDEALPQGQQNEDAN